MPDVQFVKLDPLSLDPPLNITLIRDTAGLEKLKEFFDRSDKIVGWDIETDPKKDYFWRRCRTIQFGNQKEQYVIDLLAFCDGDSELLFKAQGHYGLNIPYKLKQVIDTISPVLCSREYLKVGVSLSFEYMSFYWLFGVRPWNFFDCAMVEKCIWAGAHSMKDYGFYSMEEMMERYFLVQIDKEMQESFRLEGELTTEQVAYAALDTRFPLALRQVQLLILQGETYESLKRKGSTATKFFKNIDTATATTESKTEWSKIITGDNLMEVAKIENDAIGAFQDMHIHGERLDRERWLKRIAEKRIELKGVVAKELDPIFIPIVGKKTEVITDAEIEAADLKWKAYNEITEPELKLKSEIRLAKKLDPEQVVVLEAKRLELENARKQEKEVYKAIASDMKKRRTAIKKLADKCEGEALINYGSGAQLLNILKGMKGLKSLDDTEDDTLEKFDHIPVIQALRKHRGLNKEIGTYGEQWATEWKTKPRKEEGWLHPGDGRLHCTFNQYDAETGRSTSEKPNGQNLPQDKDVRSCFIADPPNEEIRISVCCDADTEINPWEVKYVCTQCHLNCETKPEEYVIVTADMSGAELRIIAELADDPVWIEAFGRGEDVHSVGTELLYPETWPPLAFNGQEIKDKKTGAMKPYFCEYYKLHNEETIKKNPKGTIGHPMRQKCECPEHKDLRDGNKSTNFLLAYGGGQQTLAARLKKKLEEARELMAKHAAKFPRIWAYLDRSGQTAKIMKKAFDMFGRRRLFPEPTWDKAREKAKEDREERLRYPKEEQDRNKANFLALHNRKPNKEELWLLTHRLPTNQEVANAFKAMHGTIERQGKNHCIQGTNASIAKLAMGCGFSPDGKPYLWHTLLQYKAKLIKFVHDELVVQCPKRHALKVADLIGDAFKRAAAEKMKKVVMEFDYNIGSHWKK